MHNRLDQMHETHKINGSNLSPFEVVMRTQCTYKRKGEKKRPIKKGGEQGMQANFAQTSPRPIKGKCRKIPETLRRSNAIRKRKGWEMGSWGICYTNYSLERERGEETCVSYEDGKGGRR